MTNVLEFLKSLGDTSEQVADNVQSYEVVGEMKKATKCALAVLLKKRFDIVEASVAPTGILITVKNNPMLIIIPTGSICEFIEDFDNGKYPKLIKE